MPSYDPYIDYQKLINEAVAAGNMQQAAIYEQQRNQKIKGQNLKYSTTDTYQSYLPVDYKGVLEGFTYNPEEDKLLLSAKQSYIKAGKTAMADTIGKTAAMTGGMSSSYGQAAGQQAYNSYLEKLPTLEANREETAYNRWLQENQLKLQQEQLQENRNNTQQSNYANAAWQMIQYGQMPTGDALQALLNAGYSQEAIKAIVDKVNAEEAKTQAPKSTGGYRSYSSNNEAGTEETLTPKPQETPPKTADSIYIPGFGNLTYADAEFLVGQGALFVVGKDKNGKPIFSPFPVE